MPDYGHELRFGTFITPSSNPPDAPVRLAQLSEELGFDLVTFQDHPYQPGFLDSWSLLSWVLAQTSRIHVSGNVLNLPLRQPAVMARAAISLDLLSDGRFELGLGAGGFWDAIGAMGGDRLTPGQGVDALEEAIDVIRGIWDVSERSPLHAGGAHHRVDGAQRGPAAAHDIPIWIGALKPRMLRLIGRKADGWVPSAPYLKPGDLERGMAAIDQEAAAHGRDPREIRRLLNIAGSFGAQRRGFLQGPPSTWVDDLVPLAVENGVSTFILASDDPGLLGEFAGEVLPPLREAVESARAVSGTPGGRVRSAVARLKRRAGIDYGAVPAGVEAIEPGDAKYARVRSTYMRGGSPGLVLRPADVAQVAAAIAFARGQDVPLGLRSAGHGISGRSTNNGGIVIDVGKLSTIDVLDSEQRTFRVGPGARWADVAAVLDTRGWALTSGDYGGVGVGGLATSGGIGWFAREQGLTIDHLRTVELVTASGDHVRASSEENPGLFWAMRGAGANFGIATSFEFEAHAGGDVGRADLSFDASGSAGGVAGFLERFGAAVEASPRDLTAELVMGARQPGQPIVAMVMAVVHSSDPETVIDRLQPLAGLGPLVGQSARITPYSAMMSAVQPGPHDGLGEPVSNSGLVRHLTPEFGRLSESLLENGLSYFFQIRSLGGAVNDVDTDATAFPARDSNFSIAAMARSQAAFDAAWADFEPLFSGLYLSFETSLSPTRLERAWPGKTLERLRELKRTWDPDDVFRDNFPLGTIGTPARLGT